MPNMPNQPAAYGARLGSEVREQKLQNSVQATRAQREYSKTYEAWDKDDSNRQQPTGSNNNNNNNNKDLEIVCHEDDIYTISTVYTLCFGAIFEFTPSWTLLDSKFLWMWSQTLLRLKSHKPY